MTRVLLSVVVAGFVALASSATLACEDHAMTTPDHLGMAPTATEKPLILQQAAAKPVISPTAKVKSAKAAQPVAGKPVQVVKSAGNSGG